MAIRIGHRASLLVYLAVCGLLIGGCKKEEQQTTKSETNQPPVVTPTTNYGGPTSAEAGFAENDIAPEVVGEDIDGVAFRLSEYRGKVVVLDFWGDW